MASLPMEMDIDTDTPQILPRDKPGKHESSVEFLKRLPASSTKADIVGPWIYIHTPHTEQLNDDVAEFKRRGREALFAFENQEASLRYENDCKGGSAVTLARKVRPLQRAGGKYLYAGAGDELHYWEVDDVYHCGPGGSLLESCCGGHNERAFGYRGESGHG